MFGDTKTSKSSSGNESFVTNAIHKGTVIKGQIYCEGNIRIDGKLEGTLQTKAKLVVGETGEIRGNILCDQANVEGKVEGEIHVKDILFLKKTSRIYGDIVTQKIVVEEGAMFNGGCSMGEKSISAPQKNGEERKAKPVVEEAVA